MNLYEYLFKNITLIDCDDNEWNGYVDAFLDAYENDENESSIVLQVDNKSNLIEFMESEIKSISITDIKE